MVIYPETVEKFATSSIEDTELCISIFRRPFIESIVYERRPDYTIMQVTQHTDVKTVSVYAVETNCFNFCLKNYTCLEVSKANSICPLCNKFFYIPTPTKKLLIIACESCVQTAWCKPDLKKVNWVKEGF